MTAAVAPVIRPATLADLGQIWQLELDGFEPAKRWSEAGWRSELTGPDCLVLVAEVAGRIAGAASLRTVGETADLDRIVVAPEQRRQGAAAGLLTAGTAAVRAAGAERLLLEVAVGNAPARQLYRKFGFTELAIRADYYGPGRPAAILQLVVTDVEESVL